MNVRDAPPSSAQRSGRHAAPGTPALADANHPKRITRSIVHGVGRSTASCRSARTSAIHRGVRRMIGVWRTRGARRPLVLGSPRLAAAGTQAEDVSGDSSSRVMPMQRARNIRAPAYWTIFACVERVRKAGCPAEVQLPREYGEHDARLKPQPPCYHRCSYSVRPTLACADLGYLPSRNVWSSSEGADSARGSCPSLISHPLG